MNKVILKVLVGSRAHGLATPESDADYRSVYVQPTSEILSLGHKYKGSQWLEGENEDNTAWEIGHFLSLASQCNPTILEVFKAPIIDSGINEISNTESGFRRSVGDELRELFKHVYTPQRALYAFKGYAKNQQKKFLDKKDDRPFKYAVAHVRTLVSLIELLESGNFHVNVADVVCLHDPNFPATLPSLLKSIKEGKYTFGQIIDITEKLEKIADSLYDSLFEIRVPDDVRMAYLNEFLLKVRREFWR